MPLEGNFEEGARLVAGGKGHSIIVVGLLLIALTHY